MDTHTEGKRIFNELFFRYKLGLQRSGTLLLFWLRRNFWVHEFLAKPCRQKDA